MKDSQMKYETAYLCFLKTTWIQRGIKHVNTPDWRSWPYDDCTALYAHYIIINKPCGPSALDYKSKNSF